MDDTTAQPTSQVSYRRFSDDTLSLSGDDLPVRAQNRRQTDRFFLFIFIGSVVVTIPLLIYTLSYANLDRLQYDNSTSTNTTQEQSRSELRDFEEELFYVNKFAWKTTLACLVSLGITIVIASLFRHATRFVVWGILITTWSYFFLGSVGLWLLLPSTDSLFIKIVFTAVTVVLLCILIFMKNRIRLVTMLFKEATKASFDMQAIFSVPAATMILLLIIASMFVTSIVYIITASSPTEPTVPGYLSENFVMAIIILMFAITCWVIEFIAGVHYMIISGAVTKWYFTKNKKILDRPVYTSFYVTMKYHVGTAALGSLVITVMAILRAVIRSVTRTLRIRTCANCCMQYVDAFLRLFTKEAYIITAMHGTSFIQSGKQAASHLAMNICNAVTITSIAHFVIATTNVLIVCLSVLTSYFILGDEYNNGDCIFCYVIVVFVSLLYCFTVLGTFKNAFSTLSLCICQDFILNNGTDRPYAMSRDLMKYLEDSKKVFGKIETKSLPTI